MIYYILNILYYITYVVDVRRDHYSTYTDDVVQKSVTWWLLHSTDRLDRHIQKQNCND